MLSVSAVSVPTNRRARKRLATREHISDVATRLFMERGFDEVTIDEIAEAADMGRMTIFNHFPRKEDLFFDRGEEIREVLRDALRERGPGVAPAEAYRLLAHRLVAQKSHYIGFSAGNQGWIKTVENSETLRARARSLRDELAGFLAQELSASAGQEPIDPTAHLAAHWLLATWTVAYLQAHQAYRQSRNAARARTLFLVLVDRGTVGLQAALAGTPYA